MLMLHQDRGRKNGFVRQPRVRNNNCWSTKDQISIKGSSPCLIMLKIRSIRSRLVEPKSSISLSKHKAGKVLVLQLHEARRQDNFEMPLLIWHYPAEILQQWGKKHKELHILSEETGWMSSKQSYLVLLLFKIRCTWWTSEMMTKAIWRDQALALAHPMRHRPPGFREAAKMVQSRNRGPLKEPTKQASVPVDNPRCTVSSRPIAPILMLRKDSNQMTSSWEVEQAPIFRIQVPTATPW